MIKLEHDIENAVRSVDSDWDARDTEIGLAMLRGRMQRRATARRAGVGVAVVMACAGLAWGTIGRRSSAVAIAQLERASVSASSAIRFSDGSMVTRLEAEAQVSVIEAGPERIVTSVERGQVHAEVSPRPSRVFRVVAGQVVVEALGTAFTVERVDERVGVSVQHGRVRVTWLTGSGELGAGEVKWFPPIDENRSREEAPPTAVQAPAIEPAPSAGSAATWVRAPSWKMLALQGRYLEAYALLRDQRKTLRDPDDLLLAADVARLSGHPSDAVPYLERSIRESGNHSKAAMAAFALGRVHMTSLGMPEKAALEFAEARSRAQGGSLAEDALAREVEAWAQAGLPSRARERASEYLRLYPRGQRLRAVKTFGGLE